ncbi:MAG: hypothetical protein WCU80_10425, partial [Paludibacteraceae bacterium]
MSVFNFHIVLVLLFVVPYQFFSLHAHVLISSFLADPKGYDQTYEYVELLATEDVDFSKTPYTVVFCNNGTVLNPTGWLTGSTLTYAIEINEGVVRQGESFLIGGKDVRLNGSESADISSLRWIVQIDYDSESGAGGIGLKRLPKVGLIGNGGSSADGIAVFASAASAINDTTRPQDCLFYGDSVGVSSKFGYLLPDGSFLNDSSIIYSAAKSGVLYKVTGVYDFMEDHWMENRSLMQVDLLYSDQIYSEIVLSPSVYDVDVTQNSCETSVYWKGSSANNCAYMVFLSQTDSVYDVPEDGILYNANPIFGMGDFISGSGWYSVYYGGDKSCSLKLEDGEYCLMVYSVHEKKQISYAVVPFYEKMQTKRFSVLTEMPFIKDTLSVVVSGQISVLHPSDFTQETESWNLIGMERQVYECPDSDSIYANRIFLRDSCGKDTSAPVHVRFVRDVLPIVSQCPVDTFYRIKSPLDSISFGIPKIDNSFCSELSFLLNDSNGSVIDEVLLSPDDTSVYRTNLKPGVFHAEFRLTKKSGSTSLFDSCGFDFEIIPEIPHLLCIEDMILYDSQSVINPKWPTSLDGKVERIDVIGDSLRLNFGDSVKVAFVAKNIFGITSDTCSYFIKVADTISQMAESPELLCDIRDTVLFLPTLLADFNPRWPESSNGKVVRLDTNGELLSLAPGDSLQLSFVAEDTLGLGLRSDTCSYWVLAVDTTGSEDSDKKKQYTPSLECLPDTMVYVAGLFA